MDKETRSLKIPVLIATVCAGWALTIMATARTLGLI